MATSYIVADFHIINGIREWRGDKVTRNKFEFAVVKEHTIFFSSCIIVVLGDANYYIDI